MKVAGSRWALAVSAQLRTRVGNYCMHPRSLQCIVCNNRTQMIHCTLHYLVKINSLKCQHPYLKHDKHHLAQLNNVFNGYQLRQHRTQLRCFRAYAQERVPVVRRPENYSGLRKANADQDSTACGRHYNYNMDLKITRSGRLYFQTYLPLFIARQEMNP